MAASDHEGTRTRRFSAIDGRRASVMRLPAVLDHRPLDAIERRPLDAVASLEMLRPLGAVYTMQLLRRPLPGLLWVMLTPRVVCPLVVVRFALGVRPVAHRRLISVTLLVTHMGLLPVWIAQALPLQDRVSLHHLVRCRRTLRGLGAAGRADIAAVAAGANKAATGQRNHER
jgi:hypothetical protein